LYTLNNGDLTKTLPKFTIDPYYCSDIYYAITNIDGSPIDSFLYTYDSAVPEFKVLFSVDPLLIMVKSFLMTGTLIMFGNIYQSYTYIVELTVEGGCVTTIITP
jgi:hypothetical protein